MKRIVLACSADEGYLPHISAMLASVLAHTPRRPIHAMLTHAGALSTLGQQRVAAVAAAAGATLEFVPVPERALAGLSTKKFHPACWHRVLLPDLRPDVDRVLYLDADIIALDDVAPLWDTDLRGALFAAVDNPLYPFMGNWPRHELGIDDPLEYPNSGVMLMDLVAMRAARLVDRLREYSSANPDRLLPEQDALACVARGHWLRVHPRWNVQTAFYEVPARHLAHPAAIVAATLAGPALVHFNGWFKPWHYACSHPLRELYYRHLARTPWPRRPPEYAGWVYRLLRPLPPILQYAVLLQRDDWRAVLNTARGFWRRIAAAA